MFSVKITKAEKITVQADNTELLAIDFDVLNDDVVEAHYSHGFPLSTSPEDVDAYFKDYVANYTANAERAIANAERDAALKTADDTIAAIVGVEIKN